MVFKRKIYDKLLEWKALSAGTSAVLLEGARRIGKSTIVEEFAKQEYDDYMILDFAKENNIVAINIASTHCHSCIDTEGLWTNNLVKLLQNGVNSGTQNGNELQQGTNPKYMAFLKEKVAEALKEAYNDMKPGTLTFAQKDIGEEYFNNKNRPTSDTIMSDLNRFVFTPANSKYRPTMIINIAAHPDVAGLPTSSNSGREISGDYVYYCGELLANIDKIINVILNFENDR